MKPTVLAKIVDDKVIALKEKKQQFPLADFQHQLQPSQRSFYQSLKNNKTAFILECKKASPSKGLIRPDFNPAEIAACYKNYAAVISVLTDEKYFQGDFNYLRIVSETVPQPVLCKDFIIDEYQIYLARYYQADAVLLMLSVLDDKQYLHLKQVADSLNMGVLTEVSNEEELNRAIQLKVNVVGINNRDLRDLSINLDKTRQFAPQLAKETIIISESGINSHQQIRKLSQYVNGFLIGSSLMSDTNLDFAVRRVLFGEHKICGLTRIQDAKAAYQAGATYGGLIFSSQSPRYIAPEEAQPLINSTPLKWVGVFVNEAISSVCQIANMLNLNAIQLHGDEDEQYIASLRSQLADDCQIWKAIPVTTHIPPLNMPNIDCYLLDNKQGGSGIPFNWRLLNKKSLDHVFIAGGLNINNVDQALTFNCKGLDFNSGVEQSPGIKDAKKINLVFQKINHSESILA